MQGASQVTFGRFRLDSTNECLWQGPQAIPLRPKAFAVLKLLVEHSGQLVTKRNCSRRVWPATYVSDAVLKASIRQLREAMGDDAASPRYIETAHRRGYRFIGPGCRPRADGAGPRKRVRRHRHGCGVQRPSGLSVARSAASAVLGREAEFATLREWLERALAGDRQIVFVTGEPGIGKTIARKRPVAAGLSCCARVDRQRAVPGTVRRRRGVPACARRLVATRSRAWTATASLNCCVSTLPHGSTNCRRCCPPGNERRCDSKRRAPRASGCCARLPTPSRR